MAQLLIREMGRGIEGSVPYGASSIVLFDANISQFVTHTNKMGRLTDVSSQPRFQHVTLRLHEAFNAPFSGT